MKRFAKGKAGWFAIHVGFIYLFTAIIALICYPLMLKFEVAFIVPTTIYGWIILLLFSLSMAIVPFADFIYVFLLIVDKINNNKNIQKLSFFKKISLISFLLITFLSVIILLSLCMQNFITKDRKILLKPQIMSVNYENNYLNLKYDNLPEFADSKNFTNKHNDPIFIKLKTNARKMATVKEQTRKEPSYGLYLRGWTDYCNIYKDTLIRRGEYAQVMIKDCKKYCELKKCVLKCESKPRLARPDDKCMAIQYRGLERYYVKQNENIEQLKKDIENGALIEATVSNKGFVHELKLIH